MKSHWNTDEFSEHVIRPQAQSHASECEECRVEVEDFRRELDGFRDQVHSAAERPPFFWAAQRGAIGARLRTATKWSGVRLALASTVALLAVATSLMLPAPKAHNMVASVDNPRITQDDEALMLQVDEALLSNVPDSLEPANLITNDMSNALSKAQKSSKR